MKLFNLGSFLPWFSKRVVQTENFDKIKKLYLNIKNGVDSSRDTSFLDRSTPHDLCVWSHKLLKYLPEADYDHETRKQTDELIKHLNSIKEFYKFMERYKLENYKNLSILFYGIQFYECIMSLAFIIFREYPTTMLAISEQLKKLETILADVNTTDPCCSFLLGGGGGINSKVAASIDDVIETVNKLIGDFGLVSVAEFIADIIEIFCKYVNINVSMDTFAGSHQLLEQVLERLSRRLMVINEQYENPNRRASAWSLLDLTELIQDKVNLFGAHAAAIRKLTFSFDRFYKSIIRLTDDYEKTFKNFKPDHKKGTDSARSSVDVNYQLNTNQNSPLKNIIAQVVSPVSSVATVEQIIVRYDRKLVQMPDSMQAFRQIELMGRCIQQLELVLFSLILVIKTHEDVIYPLSGHLDECTRIIEKYIRLNVIYKLVYGAAFLSKLKPTFKRIEELMEQQQTTSATTTTKFKLNSPEFVLSEFEHSYAELLYLLDESFVNVKIKAKLESQPDPLQSEISRVLEKLLLNDVKEL